MGQKRELREVGGTSVSDLSIRPMRRSDLDTAIDWAAAEGWNPGLDDADPFFAADPGGFLMGFLDNEPATSISVVSYGTDYGFLGFYICRPEYRGNGLGHATWLAGLDRLAGRTIGLDGVLAEQPNYIRAGFRLAHRNIRYGGPAIASETSNTHLVELRGTRPLGLEGTIIAYDAPLFPGPRVAFLRRWIASFGRRTVAWVENNTLRGYGSVRPCRQGYKVGPLFADSELIADRIFTSLTSRLHGEPIFIDAPEPNPGAITLAERYHLRPVFETARMYRGPAPALPIERIYGITTFELG